MAANLCNSIGLWDIDRYVVVVVVVVAVVVIFTVMLRQIGLTASGISGIFFT